MPITRTVIENMVKQIIAESKEKDIEDEEADELDDETPRHIRNDTFERGERYTGLASVKLPSVVEKRLERLENAFDAYSLNRRRKFAVVDRIIKSLNIDKRQLLQVYGKIRAEY